MTTLRPKRRALNWPSLSVLAIAAAWAGHGLGAEQLDGELPDGTPYLITMPDDWNGMVINDLDYVVEADSDRSAYFLEQGYLLSGIGRHPERRYRYDPAQEVENLMTVLDMVEDNFGQPERVIQWGTSGGGHVASAIAEMHGDRVDGVFAGCAHTPLLISGQRLDVFHTLRYLLAPDDERLEVVGLPDDSVDIVAHWTDVITQATETPEGQARIALAFALTQWPLYTAVGEPVPDDADPDQLRDAMVATALAIPQRLSTHFMYEQAGNPVGNDGVDYTAYFDNAYPDAVLLVEHLFEEAGLDLATELARVDAGERITAEAEAQAHWRDNPARSTSGTPEVPMVRLHSIGDGAVAIALTQTYQGLVAENGRDDSVRVATIAGPGHCAFTVSENAAMLELLTQRIETGEWPDASAEALNALGDELAPAEEPRFIAFDYLPFNGSWRLEAGR